MIYGSPISGKIGNCNRCENFRRRISRQVFVVDFIKTEKHYNRPMRMRDHRQNMRIEQLKRFGFIEYYISRILECTRNIYRENLNYLFDVRIICPAIYHSRTYNRLRRLLYLLEALIRYREEEADSSEYTHIVIVISVAPEAPSEIREMKCVFDILECIGHRSIGAEVIWKFGTKKGLADEAELLILKSC